VTHAETFTIESMRARVPNGEVFLNGQHDTPSAPRAIARSFLRVSPVANERMDWFADFSAPLAPLTPHACTNPGGNCFAQFQATSNDYEVSWLLVDSDRYALASSVGELWTEFSDLSGDSYGKFRLEPRVRGTIGADRFFHVTMEATSSSTDRRYAQLLVSDQPAPIQYTMVAGNTLVLQVRGQAPQLELQVCDHHTWEVNDPCPAYRFDRRVDASGALAGFPPVPATVEHVATDRRTRYDLFVSSRRAYVFLDRMPAGCAELPARGVPSGAASVAFGSVLFHATADRPLGFHGRQLAYEMPVHYDNLGFSSDVDAPVWDESRLPCAPASALSLR
jgi:hypothetical protein